VSTFTIEAENNITAHTALPAGADQSQSFSTANELAKITVACRRPSRSITCRANMALTCRGKPLPLVA
jgi:hypothetical protein